MVATDWSTRIPSAIAAGERRLDGDEYVLIPPHIGGNETKLTLVLTAGEVALAKALWEVFEGTSVEGWHEELRAYCTKIERLSHD